VEVDRKVVLLSTQPSDERDVCAQPPGCVRARCHDHRVEMRIMAHDGSSFFFDDVGDASVGIVAADGPNSGGREDDVANQSEPH
jgi:hypothetical protein